MVDLQSMAREVVRRCGVEFRQLSAITLERGRGGDRSLVILLVFLDGGSEPSFLIKITPDPDRGRLLKSEHDNLSYLLRHGSEVLKNAVPRPLCMTEIDRQHVFAETAFHGTRMKNLPPDRYFDSPEFPQHLDRVVDWLIGFHQVSAEDDPLPLAEEDRTSAAIADYRAGFDVSPALDAMLDATGRALDQNEPAFCPWHEDFCTANVLVAADGIHVIDWEHPLRRSWPLADLLHFLNSVWCIPYAKGQPAKVENYRKLLFGRHRLEVPLRAALARYTEAMNLPRDMLVPLSVMSWVVHANRKRRRLQATGAGPGAASENWPLVMFDGDRCLNLEILAELSDSYLLSRL